MTTTTVPLLDLQAQYVTMKQEIKAAINQVVESQYFILGPEVKALEAEVAAYSQCRHGLGVSSGTDALLVSLMATGIQPGDTSATLTGETINSEAITGTDVIRTVGRS